MKLVAAITVAAGISALASIASASEVCGAPSGLNFRTFPSMHAPATTTLQDGTSFTAIGTSGPWTKIQTASGQTGYVYSTYTCASPQEAADKTSAVTPDTGTNRWTSPVPGYCVTSPYGRRVLRGRVDYHPGLDLGAPCGTPVHAAAPGKVISAGWYGGYGNAVVIQHPNGLVTIYGHNRTTKVKPGQQVTQNTVISISGSTGNSTGCHVHFEVRNGLHGATQDPRNLIGFTHCPRAGKSIDLNAGIMRP